jgi:hypothetical protein
VRLTARPERQPNGRRPTLEGLEHPIRPQPGWCAVVERKAGTGDQWSDDNCGRLPTRRGSWWFDYPRRRWVPVDLCNQHARDLQDNPRLRLEAT